MTDEISALDFSASFEMWQLLTLLDKHLGTTVGERVADLILAHPQCAGYNYAAVFKASPKHRREVVEGPNVWEKGPVLRVAAKLDPKLAETLWSRMMITPVSAPVELLQEVIIWCPEYRERAAVFLMGSYELNPCDMHTYGDLPVMTLRSLITYSVRYRDAAAKKLLERMPMADEWPQLVAHYLQEIIEYCSKPVAKEAKGFLERHKAAP